MSKSCQFVDLPQGLAVSTGTHVLEALSCVVVGLVWSEAHVYLDCFAFAADLKLNALSSLLRRFGLSLTAVCAQNR